MIVFYRITPVSVLFFRDPRPFTAGEQSLARLQFPPRLTPFLGALRSKFLEFKAKDDHKQISELIKENEIEEQLKSISICWFSMFKDNEPLLPMPIDAFVKWKELSHTRFVTSDKNFLKAPLLIFKTQEEIKKSASYLTLEGFRKYQKGLSPSKTDFLSIEDLWEFENRVGLTLMPEAKISERSKFYRITVARPKKGVGFLVGVKVKDDLWPNMPARFTTRLGGEGHIAVWERVDGLAKVEKIKIQFRELVALSHIPIQKINSSEGIEISNWCLEKLDIISGWDYKNHRPKPLVKALKSGALVFLQGQASAYKIHLNGLNFSVLKDYTLAIRDNKFYLVKFLPELGEPNSLFIVKN